MSGLRVDRPCRVFKTTGNEWAWKCLCSPPVWPCTARAASWSDAQTAADRHLTIAHPVAAPVAAPVLAPVIDLAAYRTTTVVAGGVVLEFARPGGGAA